MENAGGTRHTQIHVAAVNRTAWEIATHEECSQAGFPELMTETELVCFLRIPDVSHAANPHNVVENLKLFPRLPCI